MGQQQLLLLVLGIVIVGLAVVAGINAFEENQQKSSEDALTNEAFRLASDAKAWYNKPEQYAGGGNDASNFSSDLEWQDIGVQDGSLSDGNADDLSGDYETPWGTVSASTNSETVEFSLTTKGDGSSFGTVTFDPNADEPISFSRASSSSSSSSS